MGPTVAAFPTAAALAKWIGLAPGTMREPANGYPAAPSPNRALRATLVEAARAAGRTHATELGAQYRRMVSTQGKKQVAILGAHTLAVDIGYLLAGHTPYADLWVADFDRRDPDRVRRHAANAWKPWGTRSRSPRPRNRFAEVP